MLCNLNYESICHTHHFFGKIYGDMKRQDILRLETYFHPRPEDSFQCTAPAGNLIGLRNTLHRYLLPGPENDLLLKCYNAQYLSTRSDREQLLKVLLNRFVHMQYFYSICAEAIVEADKLIWELPYIKVPIWMDINRRVDLMKNILRYEKPIWETLMEEYFFISSVNHTLKSINGAFRWSEQAEREIRVLVLKERRVHQLNDLLSGFEDDILGLLEVNRDISSLFPQTICRGFIDRRFMLPAFGDELKSRLLDSDSSEYRSFGRILGLRAIWKRTPRSWRDYRHCEVWDNHYEWDAPTSYLDMDFPLDENRKGMCRC